MTTELTDNERALLAREIATDTHCSLASYYRESFQAGWDAAMEYMAQKASEGIAHLDDECCHFQD